MNRPGPITALAPWMGGKRQLAGRIVEALGPHQSYFEPFCGSMAVILSKPVCRHEVVNDLNRDLVNVAVCLRSRALAEALLGKLHFTLVSQELYEESRTIAMEPYRGRLGDVDRAYHAMVLWWMGRNGIAGTKPSQSGFSARYTAKGGSGSVRFRSLVASLPRFSDRLQRVDVLNTDAMELLEKIPDEPAVAIYCDPPYFVKAKPYQHDFATGDHDRLASALNRFRKARVVVSYYPHDRLAVLYRAERWTWVPISITKNIANTVKRGAVGERATELLLVSKESS